MLNDFSNDEVEEFLGKFRVEIGLDRQVLEPRDLVCLAVRVRGGQVVFCLELAHRLGVLEPLAQGIDEDRIKPVDAFAVAFEQRGSAGDGVSQGHILSAVTAGRRRG